MHSGKGKLVGDAVFWVLTVISDKEQNSEGHWPATACVPVRLLTSCKARCV